MFLAELCKGSTADSDSVCLGSNPSSAAKKIDNLRQKVVDFFIQSEGLVCNRREAYVIRLRSKRYGIKP